MLSHNKCRELALRLQTFIDQDQFKSEAQRRLPNELMVKYLSSLHGVRVIIREAMIDALLDEPVVTDANPTQWHMNSVVQAIVTDVLAWGGPDRPKPQEDDNE